jgi:excisionase family DNA binding protein
MADNMTIDPNQTYSIGTAARLLGISASTVRNLERGGQLEAVRTPGGQRRFHGAELLRVRAESTSASTKNPSTVSTAATDADAKLRHSWLGSWVARAQRELPADTPADIRFQLIADLERALRTFGPESTGPEVELLFKSVVDRARQRTEDAHEAAVRKAMNGELLDYALAHLRRGIDSLPKRVVGGPHSFERRHIRATLRDQLRDSLSRRLHGDETWDQVRELTDEFLAAWYVKHPPGGRLPNSLKLLVTGATGALGGAAAVATLDPRVRAAVAKLKDPLQSLAIEVLNHFSAPPPSTSASSNQPNQPTTAPPPSQPSVGAITLRPYAYRRPRRYSEITRAPLEASPSSVTPSDGQPRPDGAPNGEAVVRNPERSSDTNFS